MDYVSGKSVNIYRFEMIALSRKPSGEILRNLIL